jgi:hypothetical protein
MNKLNLLSTLYLINYLFFFLSHYTESLNHKNFNDSQIVVYEKHYSNNNTLDNDINNIELNHRFIKTRWKKAFELLRKQLNNVSIIYIFSLKNGTMIKFF